MYGGKSVTDCYLVMFLRNCSVMFNGEELLIDARNSDNWVFLFARDGCIIERRRSRGCGWDGSTTLIQRWNLCWGVIIYSYKLAIIITWTTGLLLRFVDILSTYCRCVLPLLCGLVGEYTKASTSGAS
ncbi:hypothetical protein IQ07DRAFT_193334 [Pyrenochaeta sp. DS3sAY3a]|nr:hypothetical protein IQ07DRAFT_193334 [Pyrenochaeta sp. DS3sAY3a]